jgi:VanZ family protein
MKIFKFYKTILCFFIIVFLSIYPFKLDSEINLIPIPHFDKIVHFLFYFAFSLLFIFDLTVKPEIKKPRNILIFSVFTISFVIGAMLELVQYLFIPQRSGSFVDLSANLTGSCFGILVFYKCPKCVKFLQRF